ncbi:hypothetical protein B0H14DRAFT_3088554 [Mycena olivaceomarginata]|nr:hypothetical protein B0H14DRAFT_3088554 [Mycena olivaceomarginata]
MSSSKRVKSAALKRSMTLSPWPTFWARHRPSPLNHSLRTGAVPTRQLIRWNFLRRSRRRHALLHQGQISLRMSETVSNMYLIDLAAPPSPIWQSSGAGVKPRAKRYLSSTPHYRCVDCDIPDLFCKSCIVRAHASHPLDRIELLAIHPSPAHKNFMVIHTNGMHKVGVDFCGCVDEEILLRHSWFPATAKEPETCSTFRVLDMFHTMTLQGKVTTYDFYSGLEKLTDNSGLRKMKDRYKGFMRTMREWRHLTMLKQGGRGNDGDRLVAETWPGELAVVCPACLQPGVNLPADWESASGEERFLYILYIAIDACFRLKRRLVSSELKDPGLGSGWSYFTETARSARFCCRLQIRRSGLVALDYANTKFSRGYGATGMGLGVYARHEFVQRNGAADLQKGEGYANMDYILGSLLHHHYWRLRKYLSYDICCQWSKYLIERMKEMPNGIKLNFILSLLRFVIPKLHIYGHKLACQLNFSLNYTPGAGRTDGEGIERPWANIGLVATSTREMGPGSHQDMLNDHWGHWNWQKLVGLGALLRKRLLRAIPERNFQRDSLATFTKNQGEHVEEWVAMVLAFEADGTSPNPYELPKSGANEHDVRLECVEEEAAEQDPSAFIIAGLDLEEQQRHIKVAVAIVQKSESSKNSADVVKSRTKLARYVAVYMPGALQALADRPVAAGEEGGMLAENVPLFLPSALSAELQASGCNKGVDRIEHRFRDAQCRSALDGIRNYLHIKSRFRTYKGGQVQHQGATTRARALMDRNDEKMQIAGEKYIAAWEAKRVLVGEANVDWHRLDRKKDLRCMDKEEDRAVVSERKRRGKKWGKGEVANEEDVRDGVQEGQRRKDPMGEGRRTMSWIWMGVDTSSVGTSEAVLILNAGLRVEWCKAWARTRRWTEEVQLLKEEMRRTPLALHHKAWWWLERRAPTGFEGRHVEGAAAYVTSQAALYKQPRGFFREVDVDDAVLLRLNKQITGTDSDNEEEEDELDPEEADEEDGNDGVDGEEGGEEEQNGEEEEEGSAGGESGGEDDD